MDRRCTPATIHLRREDAPRGGARAPGSGLREPWRKIGLPVLLENMNKEPADAEVNYLGFNLEECQYSSAGSSRRPCAGRSRPIMRTWFPMASTASWAGSTSSACGEVRVADCWGTKEEHLKPGQGISTSRPSSASSTPGLKGHHGCVRLAAGHDRGPRVPGPRRKESRPRLGLVHHRGVEGLVDYDVDDGRLSARQCPLESGNQLRRILDALAVSAQTRASAAKSTSP